ncbi:lipopolysaccharide-induced tumor necrosis factor-alpha factor homolog [Onthophagus taurus]|uniref:lipopolysaccharide-induced tumor necrosis factor-alpha factor homolog n=1 Tax=Onthophagus taurus TaxID=166361 RepID=UPI000C20951D|nr:lipopolysaccharide-induced tumor necrosis factor-alpha factor homolog [Onthophagus taurus]XP_022899707.1 lipopolysaccharide-induced tumor necrosis factor-alpha factor homolog [Onthophagus taurus]XP_022899718.1 lipopolysaccharide-induced tumor necrosis factor-alpha factor homolog [Onthophagus taurus]
MEKSNMSQTEYMPCPQNPPPPGVSPPDLAPPQYAPPQYTPTQSDVPSYAPPQSVPVQQVHTTTVLHSVAPLTQYGPKQQNVTCPSCNNRIITKTESKATSKTHLWAFCLFICGCWPCCCIPYCMDSCMNTNHYCPNCSAFLGTYQS